MPLIWTPIDSVANWSPPPAPPKVVRAALAGVGWLVATEVAGGWSTTFVPDAGAGDPADDASGKKFQAAKIHWKPPRQGAPGGRAKAEAVAREPRHKQEKK